MKSSSLLKLLTILVSLASTALFAYGQSNSGEIVRTPGEVVAKGTNDNPVGKWKVKSYRLEYVKRYDAYKLVITGGPFVCDCTVWINDFAYSGVSSGTGEIVVLLPPGRPKFEEGATISVAAGWGSCDMVSESILPEKLSVPPEFRAPPPDPNRIHLRTVRSVARFGGRPGVAVEVEIPGKSLVQIMNGSLYIQIGRKEFLAGGSGPQFSTIVPYDTFLSLPENAQVIVKAGRCSRDGLMAARLNKSMLDH